jgi:hypothetical protein
MVGDAQHPGPEGAIAEAAQLAKGAQKGLLADVVGSLRVAQHPVRLAIDPVLVLENKPIEGFQVSLAGKLDQFGIHHGNYLPSKRARRTVKQIMAKKTKSRHPLLIFITPGAYSYYIHKYLADDLANCLLKFRPLALFRSVHETHHLRPSIAHRAL